MATLPRGSGGVVSLEIAGIDTLREILRRASSNTSLVFARALYEEANLIMADSVNLVPVRRGTLRASADVSLPRISRDTVEIEFGYGGAAADYAVEQHENTTYRHAPGRTSKFLETPALQRAADFDRRIARRLGAIFGEVR